VVFILIGLALRAIARSMRAGAVLMT
jgi:hypothetical protein